VVSHLFSDLFSNPSELQVSILIKRSKASLINDDNLRVSNGLSYVIGTDIKYTFKCSALTDEWEHGSLSRARDSLQPLLGWLAIMGIVASLMSRFSACRLSKTARSRWDGAEEFIEALQL